MYQEVVLIWFLIMRWPLHTLWEHRHLLKVARTKTLGYFIQRALPQWFANGGVLAFFLAWCVVKIFITSAGCFFKTFKNFFQSFALVEKWKWQHAPSCFPAWTTPTSIFPPITQLNKSSAWLKCREKATRSPKPWPREQNDKSFFSWPREHKVV